MRLTWLTIPVLLSLFVAGCAERVPTPSAPTPGPAPVDRQKPAYSQSGKASFYARMHHGMLTANGEKHDQNALVAAHRSLPFGTRVLVTNLKNDKQVTVRINDRGPFKRGRIIDLSRAAAQQIDMIDDGVVSVRIETLD